MTVKTFCFWCLKPVAMSDGFDEKKSKPFCSIGCLNAEMLFNLHFGDEEINRREHYRYLTRGEDKWIQTSLWCVKFAPNANNTNLWPGTTSTPNVSMGRKKTTPYSCCVVTAIPSWRRISPASVCPTRSIRMLCWLSSKERRSENATRMGRRPPAPEVPALWANAWKAVCHTEVLRHIRWKSSDVLQRGLRQRVLPQQLAEEGAVSDLDCGECHKCAICGKKLPHRRMLEKYHRWFCSIFCLMEHERRMKWNAISMSSCSRCCRFRHWRSRCPHCLLTLSWWVIRNANTSRLARWGRATSSSNPLATTGSSSSKMDNRKSSPISRAERLPMKSGLPTSSARSDNWQSLNWGCFFP